MQNSTIARCAAVGLFMAAALLCGCARLPARGAEPRLGATIQKRYPSAAAALAAAAQEKAPGLAIEVRLLSELPAGEVPEEVRRKLAHPQAYWLRVDKDRARVVGADEPGALNGMIALEVMLARGAPEAGEWIDWPELQVRALHFTHLRGLGVDRIKELVGLARRARFNLLVMGVSDGMNFKSLPRLDDERKLSREQIRDLLEYARGSGMEVVPEVKLLTHQEKFLADKYPEIMYNKSTYDPSNPRTYEIVLPALDEIVEVFLPRAVLVGHDEVAGHNENARKKMLRAGEKVLPPELFLKDVETLDGHLRKRKVETWMWGDMLLAPAEFPDMFQRHLHGASGFAALRGKIPKDVTICDWHYFGTEKEFPSTKAFADAGHRVFGCTWKDGGVIRHYSRYVRGLDTHGGGMMATTWHYFGGEQKPVFTQIVEDSGRAFWGAGRDEPTPGAKAGAKAPSAGELIFENDAVRLTLDARGRSVSLIDKATGKERIEAPAPFASVTVAGKSEGCTGLKLDDGVLRAAFGRSEVSVDFKAKSTPGGIAFEVARVEGAGRERLEQLDFLGLDLKPLKQAGSLLAVRWDDEFAACLMALDDRTHAHLASGDANMLCSACLGFPSGNPHDRAGCTGREDGHRRRPAGAAAALQAPGTAAAGRPRRRGQRPPDASRRGHRPLDAPRAGREAEGRGAGAREGRTPPGAQPATGVLVQDVPGLLRRPGLQGRAGDRPAGVRRRAHAGGVSSGGGELQVQARRVLLRLWPDPGFERALDALRRETAGALHAAGRRGAGGETGGAEEPGHIRRRLAFQDPGRATSRRLRRVRRPGRDRHLRRRRQTAGRREAGQSGAFRRSRGVAALGHRGRAGHGPDVGLADGQAAPGAPGSREGVPARGGPERGWPEVKVSAKRKASGG